MAHAITPLSDRFFHEKNSSEGIDLTGTFGITTVDYHTKVYAPILSSFERLNLREESETLTRDFVSRIESVREEVMSSIADARTKNGIFCLGMIEAMKMKVVRDGFSGAALGRSDLERMAQAIVRVQVCFVDPGKLALPSDWTEVEARQKEIVIEDILKKADPKVTSFTRSIPKELTKIKKEIETEVEDRISSSISTINALEKELIQFFEKNGDGTPERRDELIGALNAAKKRISKEKLSDLSSRFEEEKRKLSDVLSLKKSDSSIESIHLSTSHKGRDAKTIINRIEQFATRYGQMYIPLLVKELQDQGLISELETKLRTTSITVEQLLLPTLRLSDAELDTLKTAIKEPSKGFFARIFG
jgi:hypothetical protein